VITVGVQTWGTDVAALARYWAAAEDLGYDRIVYGDGLGPWTLDGWSMLAALAVATRRARIGPAVTYCFDAAAHHPSWLAKRAVTVDHLAGGRLDLRLAVGAEDPASRDVWERHGIRYPGAAERVARLEETLVILRALFVGGPVDHEGRFYTLRGATLSPEPVQRPGPPLWVAAMGRRALEVAVRHADGWEASYVGPGPFAARWAEVQRGLEEHGRGAETFRRSVEVDVAFGRSAADGEEWLRRFCAARGIDARHPLVGTALVGEPGDVRRRLEQYEAAGVTDLVVGFADFPATGMLVEFAEAILPLTRVAR
jgi:alkanesulfonate monooxygenase SsuD/methylene tetrahydromethanopterin reductase-like flavin-dependent oxidoreductase (luciferase family)